MLHVLPLDGLKTGYQTKLKQGVARSIPVLDRDAGQARKKQDRWTIPH